MQKKKKKDLKIAGGLNHPIDYSGHKKVNKGAKIYNKGVNTDNPHEKDTFMKRTGPLDTPFFKKVQRKTKKRYG